MKTLGFIGGGRITRILLNGFKNANVSFETIYVYETNETVLSALKTDYPRNRNFKHRLIKGCILRLGIYCPTSPGT